MTDTNSVHKAAEEVAAQLQGKGLDVLVNNAGTQNWNEGGISKLEEQDLMSVFDLNVVGVQRVTAAFLPLLEKGGEKKVVNMYVSFHLIFLNHSPTVPSTHSGKSCAAQRVVHQCITSFRRDDCPMLTWILCA